MKRGRQRPPLFNREYSWIEFNRRVLGEARNPDVPLLERVKFLAIASTNLDEFLMVRVGGLTDLIEAGITEKSADGLTPLQELRGIRSRTRKFMKEMYACLNKELLPALKEHGIEIADPASLNRKQRETLLREFETQLEPVLTPLALDSGHPFPFLANLAMNLAIQVRSRRHGDSHLALMKMPALVPRFIPTGKKGQFVLLESLIARHAENLFPGMAVEKIIPFRVLRNADFEIKGDDVQTDLLQSVEAELKRRERQEVVWIEIEGDASDELVKLIADANDAHPDDVFCTPGPPRLSDMMQIANMDFGDSKLKDPPFNPRIPPRLATTEDIFSIIRSGDVLLHRPYDSFTAVVEFVQAAAEDPDVVAIKTTLYRSDPDAPIVSALAKAAQSGKQVAVVVELQARFDEQKNIGWARHLEQAGVQVVYGLAGIKTHVKLCLVVRREGKTLNRYLHLSTGNYHAATARLYTDVDLFTTKRSICDDASQMMNLLTGFSLESIRQTADGDVDDIEWEAMVVSPFDYHDWVIARIEKESKNAKEGKPARIIAKMNSLVDSEVIKALYQASSAGVNIELLIRGSCCLVPGVAGTSENIRVASVVDRFLEHSRILYFENGGKPEVWVTSGDWMPRNFFRRFEACYPILDKGLKTRLIDEILGISLKDDTKAWVLQSDGSWTRAKQEEGVRSQERFIEIARAEAAKLLPYEEAIKKPGKARRKAKRQKKK